MRTWFQGVVTTLALFSSTIASQAQWVAFNDHAPGPGTGPYTSFWNVENQAPGRTGLLTNAVAGTLPLGATLPVTLTISIAGNVTFEGSQGNPASGTPLYNTFNGFVDFNGAPNPSLALNGAGAVVTYTFTGLDPNKRYSLKGSAVRAGGYLDRWTLFELASADTFSSAHTANALTTAQVPSILPNQCAIDTGLNDSASTGDMADWENIDPGPDGMIAVNSYQYLGPIAGFTQPGPKGYAMTGFRLEEFNVTPTAPVITNQPQSLVVGELQTATFTVGASGNPRVSYQWLKNNSPITDATNAVYSYTAPLSDNNAVFKVVVSNVTNGHPNSVTSSDATLTVNADLTAPTLVRAVSVAEDLALVTFSEPVLESTATNIGNYTITGPSGSLAVTGATLQSNGTNVLINTAKQAANTTYTVRVNGVRDLSAASNQIAANSTITFNTAVGYTLLNVGAVGQNGSVVTTPDGFDVSGSGSDIGGTADQFTLGYQQRTGDFDIKARIQGLSPTDPWSKAGLMARQGALPNSAFAATFATPSASGSFFEARATAGATATISGSAPVNYPDTWVRLRRVGNVFTGFASLDGQEWVQLGTATVVMSDPILFGLAVSSHANTTLATAQFREIGSASGTIVPVLSSRGEPLGPSSRRTGLAITEIMYNPASNGVEFIEIYNSQGFFENIGGYRISGDADFTFPANTIIPAGGFIVVTPDPAALQSVSGYAGAMGPLIGSLPNDKGTVRLRSKAGAVLLEVKYDSKAPWPVAPDGTGHSLVLSRASYGEGDPKAWAASDKIGGSPGAADALGAASTVVINEILAHTEGSANTDYIELYNHGKQAVDLSGAWITDANTNSYRLPNGSTIQANGFLSFNQNTLGFAFHASGDRALLIQSNQLRVLDAVRFDAQANGVSSGRYPDGANTWRALGALTPGEANGPGGLKSWDIVINELMYDPVSGNNKDEYIELYNKGVNPIDLAGWKFVDGVDFTFPSNSIVPAGGYFVIGKSQTNLLAHYNNLTTANTVGDYDGTLGNGGEHVALAMPELNPGTNALGQPVTNTIYVVVSDLTYGKAGRWGAWSSGGGSSLELVDPNSDIQQPANWADSDETGKGQWTSFEFTGGIGETLGSPINDNVEVALLGIGECLVDEVELHNGGGANLIPNPGFENDATSWTFQGSHDLSSIEPVGFAGAKSLHIRAGSRGDNGGNRVRSGAVAASGTITLRAKAKWIRGWPEVLVRLHGGGAEVTGKLPVPTNLGTPGAQNSRYAGNAGPAVYDVAHSPVLPQANVPVVVTAKLSDPNGVYGATVRYRVDPSGTINNVAMLDDGTGGDAIANDGIYSATIPGQPANALIAFYIVAVDNLNATNLFPQDVFPKGLARVFPNDAPTRECVIRWGDVQMPGNFATYHLWLTTVTSNRWATRDPLNNAMLDGTFVYNDYRAIYNSLPLYAGSPWHRGQMTTGPGGSQRVDYVMNFRDDDRLLGQTDFVFNNPGNPGGTSTSDTSAQSEQTSYILFKEIGVVYNHRRYVHYFLNGSQRSTSANVSGNFIFEDSQQPNGDMIEEWFPDDTDGELYKIEDWFEFNDNGYDFSSNNDADLIRRLIPGTSQLATAPYRFMFRKRSLGSGDSASDYTTFFNMLNAVSPTTDQAAAINLAAIDPIVDWEQWMRVFAVQRTCGNWDSYGFQRGKNDYAYKPINGRFQQMTWDIDFTMGVGGNGASDALFGTETDPRVIAMKNEPTIRRAYMRAFSDIVNGPLNNSFMDPILDAKYAAMRANNVNADINTVNTIKTYVRGRHDFLTNQLFQIAVPFGLTGGNSIVASNNLVTLSGTASVDIKTIRINGLEYPIKWTSVNTFTILLAADAGVSTVTLQGYDSAGNPMPGNLITATISYTGPVVNPKDVLVINEIMYNPAVSNASYVEIYNNSATFSFDLSNWRISGLDYTFPSGTIISNKQFLVLAKDRAVFAATYGLSIPVFDEFEGNLDPDGEKLALIKPGATPDQDLMVNAVRYEAGSPWPSLANGGGSSLQLTDPSQDESRVSNWSDGSGWRFFSFTGTPGLNTFPTNFSLTLSGAGDFYIDDFSLVAGTVAGAGQNVFQNGDFEAGVLSPWAAIGNHSGSAISTAVKHGGNASLHVVGTAPGSLPSSMVFQPLSGVINTNPYTLSFWYLPSLTVTGFDFRITPSFRTLTPVNLRPSPFSPGAANAAIAAIDPFPLLWINEIQPNNVNGITDHIGEHDPWLELYNSGSTPITLDGYALANDFANLNQWLFPNGTVINAGEYKVIFVDGQPGQTLGGELHAGFRLSSTNGSVILSQNGRILDYINYPTVANNYSYGSFPNGQLVDRQPFFYVTPGAANNGSPVPVIINEWLASNTNSIVDPATGRLEDWIELYNFGTLPIDLSGYFLTDDTNKKKQWAFPQGTVIAAGGYLLIWADNAATNSTPNDLHAGFALGRNGESIALYTPDLLVVDQLNFGPQGNNISQGRYPDGNFSGVLHFMTTPTPLAANVVPFNQFAPSLPAIPNQSVNEGSLLTFNVLATDNDQPVQTLTYSLDPGAPAGASINAQGVFKWTPTEAQGGSVYGITIRVSDNGAPLRTDSKTVNITVNKVNSAPVLFPVAPRTVAENSTVSFTVVATDSDLPPQTLSFALDASAPAGASIDSSGFFSWTPTEAQGPGTYVIPVMVTDSGTPSASATQAVTITVTEVNTGPVLANPGTLIADEGKLFTNTLVVTDNDLPAQRITFVALGGVPTGLTINSLSGLITWTPSETQGGSNYTITVRASDNGTPSMSSTQTFTITVNEVNVAPVLNNLNNTTRTINELTSITLTNRATDVDAPTNILTYEIVSAPTGATVNPTNGIFAWTPSEAQGPSSNSILVRVYDNGVPSLSATQRFTILVNEVNSAPILSPIQNKSVAAGQQLTFTAVVNDPDLPAQVLTFNLEPGAPSGATIDAGGIFSWTPASGAPPSTNQLKIRVVDNGAPSLSATQTFTIFVTVSIRITGIQTVDATHVSISWETQAGKNYQVEYRDDLDPATSWQPLPNSQVTANGTSSSLSLSTTASAQRFYRIVQTN